MTLLAPTAALVAAGICVPALAMLYMLKLRRRPVRVGSILFWEQATQDLQANVPLRWIRVGWLFLLHLLVVLLLCVALGRPAADWSGLPGTRERVILVIDRSASMNAREGDPAGADKATTRLDQAKDKARDIIAGLSGGRSAAIISLAGEPAIVARFTASKGILRDSIDRLQPTDQAGDLASAMELASVLARPDAGEGEARSVPTEIVLLSDGSFRSPVDRAIAVSNASARLISLGSTGERDNLGIVQFSAMRDDDDPAAVRVFARVLNASAEARTVPVALALDAGVVERSTLTIPGATREAAAFASASLTIEAPRGGVLTLTLGRADALTSDNSASLVLDAPRRPRILLVAPSQAAASALDRPGDWILSDALAELRPQWLRRTTPVGYESLAASGTLGTPGLLDTPDLIVFDRVAPATSPPVPSLSLGALPPLPGLSVQPESPPADDLVTIWDRAHPTLRHVSLDSVVLKRASVLTLDERAASAGGVREIARGKGGPLILAQEAGVRRVAVAFDLAASNWPLQVGFPIFLASAVDHLTLRAQSLQGRSFTTSEGVSVRLAPSAPAGTVTLVGPETVTASPPPAGETEARAGVLARAGVYEVRGAGALDEFVAVNLLDETESALGVRESLAFASAADQREATRGLREVWHLFVLAACALLLIEWLLYAWRMRV